MIVSILEMGTILGIMALGVYLSFRVLDLPDLTCDGSFALGGAITVASLLSGVPVIWCIVLGALGGALAGFATGMIHTRLKVNSLLAGILVMTMIYSINLRIMNGPNLPVPRVSSNQEIQSFEDMSGGTKLDDLFSDFGEMKVSTKSDIKVNDNIFNNDKNGSDLFLIMIITAGIIIILSVFLRTDIGMAVRAFGSNKNAVQSFGISKNVLAVLGLVIGNFLVGLSGSLFSLYSGFADVQMGQSMIVTGLAAVMLGEIILSKVNIIYGLLAPIVGGILYQLLLSLAIKYGYRIGLLASDMKLLTALFIIAVIGISLVTQKDGKRKFKKGVKKIWSNSKA